MSTSQKPTGIKQGYIIWFVIAVLGVSALTGTYFLFVEAPPPRKIIIATGGKTGAYYKFATQYAAELKDQGLTVEVMETKGSVKNLELLRDPNSGVDVAIVQSGVSSAEDRKHLLALGSLYREPLFVFYRSEKKLFEDKPPPKKVVIATGGKAGAYFKFANEYAAELAKEGLILEVKETNGSVENLQLLSDASSGVTAALVQSGIASDEDRKKLVALGSLYREPLWVFSKIDAGVYMLISLMENSHIYVGKKGSGTYPVAMKLLEANGVVGADGKPKGNSKIIEEAGDFDLLKTAEPNVRKAAFFVASVETPFVQKLLKDSGFRVMSFVDNATYQRRFRFLSEVTMPAGLIELGARKIPETDVHLVSPMAMLVVTKDMHPSVSALLLGAAAKVHAKGDLLSNPGEFPSASYTDIPISDDAKQYYRGGVPQKVPPIDRLSYFEGKRIGVGVKGSGVYAIAMELLKANGLVDAELRPIGKTVLVEEAADVAADKLASDASSQLDVGFFVAAMETGYIDKMMKHPNVRLFSFAQHEAYSRKFRFLSEVTIPAGLVNLGYNVPRQDINLVAPTAMLVTRKGVHPALVSLLLTTASRVHSKGDQFSSPGEFPSAAFTDIPVSEDAKHFYKSGPPLLQRYMPFWLASLADRLKIMLIPLVMLLMPMIRAAPPLARWRTRRKIYRWYAYLRDIDKKIALGLTPQQLEVEIAQLKDINHQVAFVEVPLSYMEEFYHLRLHLAMVEEKLESLKKS